jgi:phenylacetic acid degradation operon negative regulatory protein
MKIHTIDKWIDRSLATDPPRSKSVTMTVFGDLIAPHGSTVWLGSLIELLAPFGISDRLVRTSVFRLADEGWLEARREGRRSLYTLTPAGERRVERAYRRIYAPPNVQWGGSWTLLFATPGSISVATRGKLRKELQWEGFSMIAPGVFAHPTSNLDVLEEILVRTDMSGKLFICQASELPQLSARPLGDLVGHGWDLEPVLHGYQEFIDRFGHLARYLSAKNPIEPRQSFVIRALLMHAFRRVQLHDPLLPLDLLPASWPGIAAYELCRQIYQLTYADAERYLIDALECEQGKVPPAAASFYQRFGGLT